MKKLELLEPEIGEYFEYKGRRFKCVKNACENACRVCAFKTLGDCLRIFACASGLRKDGEKVYFEVAEPQHVGIVINLPEKPLDVPVGRAVRVNGNSYLCTSESTFCGDCDVRGAGVCGNLECIGSHRADKTGVVFKKINVISR